MRDFLCITRALSVEDEFIVATDEMSSKHDFRLADDFEDGLVERSLHDAVIILHDQHVLLVTSQGLCDQLSVLNLIIIEPSTVSFDTLKVILIDRLTISILSWNLEEDAAEDEDRLLVDVRIGRARLLIHGQPWVRFEAHKAYFMLSPDKEHDIAIGFFSLLE